MVSQMAPQMAPKIALLTDWSLAWECEPPMVELSAMGNALVLQLIKAHTLKRTHH